MKANREKLWIVLGLVAITIGLFAQVAGFEFLNYDDDDYVFKNPYVREGLSLEGLRWAFTSPHAANWHPLTWLSHMLDVQLFGLNAGMHHLVNVFLHAASAALLFLAVSGMTQKTWPSALVALLFAIHPLRAESVAWIAERKDVLSGLFFMATLLCYGRYVRRPTRRGFVAVTIAFALGLLSKPMLVTLPPLLLLLDLWPLQRFGSSSLAQLVREKALWFAMAIASAVITFLVQDGAGAVSPAFALGFEARISNSFSAYMTYVRQSFWPSDLCAIYIHPGLLERDAYRPWAAVRALSALLVVVLSVAAWRSARRAPMFTTGWFWFLGTAFPVIGGLVQVGFQAHADRYTYLPTIGLGLALVFGIEAHLHSPRARRAGLLVGGLAALVLLPTSWRQIGTWSDTPSVFERALEITDSNFIAHTNLGEALQKQGQLGAAVEQYGQALEIRPNLYQVRTNLAEIHLGQGRLREALRELDLALRYDPKYVRALWNKALALANLGQDRPSLEVLQFCLEVAPNEHYARNQLAWILSTSRFADLRDPERAYQQASLVCRATGNQNPTFLETMAAAAAALGRFDEATELQDRAMRMHEGPARRAARVRLDRYRQEKTIVQGAK